MNRWKYEEYIRGLADTCLYEETLKIIKEVERHSAEGGMSASDCHNMNTIIFTEFARRDKHQKYYDAFNQVQLQCGRKAALVK